MTTPKIAILCDFDDTVVQGNVAHLILDGFGDPSWRELRRLYREGRIPAEEYFQRPFEAMKATRDQMAAHVRAHGRVNHGFRDLADFCRERGLELAIVTLSLDFSVRALLEAHGLEWVPVYGVGTRFTPEGLRFEFPHARKECGRWGICKCAVVRRYQGEDKKVFYVGDGTNDLCPARISDVVFARDRLLELCRAEGITHVELREFTDVIAEVERRLATVEGASP